MEGLRRVRGTELRYLLTWWLARESPLTVGELIECLEMQGFDVGGRPSKTISDALRWEMRRGRVIKGGRNSYRIGYVPRATEYRIRQRVLAMRAEVAGMSLEAGRGEGTELSDEFWDAWGF
ncbi:hypothetical protein [Mycolicibacterium goodii]|uniref:Uncharacterized protein n=2 Tax=Mycolicibacterium goodii TaxID=134601 RepID=A0ABS6HTA5_MYCGD|nr:hypothetical protein [Mycolicibacterium goodii]MBU8809517.1 hypothetical protein [Mycolicibacterium goodii]MBU8825438.1 hypothetical protein [Mycolicibacterium goodii]MBU8838584.1 hypothetical protein [Mycolicibacterium goodii]OKH74097.1 hypothetical protein EB74_12305 [Mycobacterium sp. SWH-M5]